MIAGGPIWLLLLLRFIEITSLLVMTIFWVRSMQRTLRACAPSSRMADPSSPGLIMIPLFGLIWQFVANTNVSESIAREYRRRGWHLDENRPGFEQGMVACLIVCAVVLIRTSYAVQFPFHFFSTLVVGNLHPGFGFVGSIIIGFCMYRHMDRLASYRERMETEPDPSLTYSQQPLFAFQQYASQQQWPQQPNAYPPQNYPPVMPPVNQPAPVYPQYPPPPQNPAPDLSKWMPPSAQPEQKENNAQDENDRWRPKYFPPAE